MPSRIYDTAAAAQLLGCAAFGLSALLQRHFGVELPKSSQRADWSCRPLTPKMLAYAVNDTVHLLNLADRLEAELREKGRAEWRRQACRRALEDAAVDREVDPGERWRIRGWRSLEGPQLALLRELWRWREDQARRSDRPPFKVLGNEALLELAVWAHAHPAAEAEGFPRLPRNLRGSRLAALSRAIKKGRSLPESAWPGIPKSAGKRADASVSLRAGTLREARNSIAAALAIDPGVLTPNAAVLAIAEAAPRDLHHLREAGGLLPWQAEAVGQAFLEILRAGRRDRGE